MGNAARGGTAGRRITVAEAGRRITVAEAERRITVEAGRFFTGWRFDAAHLSSSNGLEDVFSIRAKLSCK